MTRVRKPSPENNKPFSNLEQGEIPGGRISKEGSNGFVVSECVVITTFDRCFCLRDNY